MPATNVAARKVPSKLAPTWFRKLWFQLHWLLGLSAGTVLAVIGISGAALSFEKEIIRALNPALVSPNLGPALAPPELFARIQAATSGRRINQLTIFSDAREAASVSFAPPPGVKRGESRHLDPRSGALLPAMRGEQTLHFLEDVHRRLAAGDRGKAVTGACTIALLILAGSGLYLRWPRSHSLRRWFAFDWNLSGRGFLDGLHRTLGTWLLLPYLLAALTGLFFSYDWYRKGVYALSGAAPPQRQAKADSAPPTADLEKLWPIVSAAAGDWRTLTLRLPQHQSAPLQVMYLAQDAPHDRAINRLNLDTATGAIQLHARYGEQHAGQQLVTSMFALHSGSFFGLAGRLIAMLAALLMPLFAITGWQMYLARRRMRRRLQPQSAVAASAIRE